ncbi:hypothetical protein [Frischella perrara]|nr:hypothetical protein [Frischella perrara]
MTLPPAPRKASLVNLVTVFSLAETGTEPLSWLYSAFNIIV